MPSPLAKPRPLARLVAAAIAAVAWVGLAVQFTELHRTHTALASLAIMLAFFTITTNLLVALVFSALALNRTPLRSAFLVAGTALSILLVGVINALLLWGLLELSGGSALVDRLLHVLTPTAVPLFWLLATPKGTLRRRDPLLWAIYPLAYLCFSLARGALTGQYPYPFINVAVLGWPRIALNAALIALAFLVAGSLTVSLDHRLAQPRPGSAPV